LFAQLSARFGDFEKARTYLNESIRLKNNYTEALFLLSQLDIEEGKTENAIKVTQEIISIEPYNQPDISS
jgi:tetratricopeptide (TPR) repeat protein